MARKRQQWLVAIRTVVACLAGPSALGETLQTVAAEFHKVALAGSCHVYRAIGSPAKLELAAAAGTPLSQDPATGCIAGESYAHHAIRRAPLLHIRDLARSEPSNDREALLDLDLRTCVGLPLSSGGRILGAVVLFGRKSIPTDIETVRFFETLAGLAALAISQRPLEEQAADDPGHEAVDPAPPSGGLTRSQLAILRLVVEGRSNREIAGAVHLSENTVKFHVRELFRKLNARNRVEAAMAAVRRGLL